MLICYTFISVKSILHCFSTIAGGSLNTSIVCNHLRAWQLFLESLKTKDSECELWSFPCSGGWSSFIKGNCFPFRCTGNIPKMKNILRARFQLELKSAKFSGLAREREISDKYFRIHMLKSAKFKSNLEHFNFFSYFLFPKFLHFT